MAPAALGLDSMDKVRRESGSAHTPVTPYARAREPARADATPKLGGHAATARRRRPQKEFRKQNNRRPGGCFPRARGFDSARVNAAEFWSFANMRVARKSSGCSGTIWTRKDGGGSA